MTFSNRFGDRLGPSYLWLQASRTWSVLAKLPSGTLSCDPDVRILLRDQAAAW